MEYVTLNNGIKMPKLGYGVYQTPAEDTRRCVLDASTWASREHDLRRRRITTRRVLRSAGRVRSAPRGIFLTTRVLENLMKRHPQSTYLIILGFMFGSLPELFPGIPGGKLTLAFAVLLFGPAGLLCHLLHVTERERNAGIKKSRHEGGFLRLLI